VLGHALPIALGEEPHVRTLDQELQKSVGTLLDGQVGPGVLWLADLQLAGMHVELAVTVQQLRQQRATRALDL